MMLAQASEVQMVKWLKGLLGWSDKPGQAVFHCPDCGETFEADAMDPAPIHGQDWDGVACVTPGTRMRRPAHRAEIADFRSTPQYKRGYRDAKHEIATEANDERPQP